MRGPSNSSFLKKLVKGSPSLPASARSFSYISYQSAHLWFLLYTPSHRSPLSHTLYLDTQLSFWPTVDFDFRFLPLIALYSFDPYLSTAVAFQVLTLSFDLCFLNHSLTLNPLNINTAYLYILGNALTWVSYVVL